MDSTVHNFTKKDNLEAIAAEITSFADRHFSELSQVGGNWRNQNEAQPSNTWNNRFDESSSAGLHGSNFLEKVKSLDKY